MAISENKAIFIENLRGVLLSKGEQISGVLQKVATSSHFSEVQRKDFDERIKPILIEINRFINDLKSSNLESFIDDDLRNLYSCFSSGIHNKFFSEINNYMKIKVDSQESANQANIILKEIRDIYNNFLYGVNVGADWENSFINIINKRNSLDRQDVFQVSDLIKVCENRYIEAKETLENATVTASDLIRKSDDLFKQRSIEAYIQKYENEAETNLHALLVCIVAFVLLVISYNIYVLDGLDDSLTKIGEMKSYQYYYFLFKSILVSMVFLTIMGVLIKSSFAFIHNYLMNREKASALFAFDKFFTESDDVSVKTLATLEVTKTVLGTRENGFLNYKIPLSNDLETLKSLVDNFSNKK